MKGQTPAEQALSHSYVTADGLRFGVIKMTADHHPDRSMTLTYWLTVGRQGHIDERWVVALPWDDKSWVDVLTSPAPPSDRLGQLVSLVHAHAGSFADRSSGASWRSAKLVRQ
ncbi:hypothetical protein OG946_01190 [Streptomyces sp. NBC_01808]|uniref:hypothetical protein n=1 Tax=Streptomyces sp. NBC_01808 TaxID=2975947 RepID=UPI002DDC59F4|nr:hypothetical protein [Streptomyces sp. NBC_01808]WSA36105.1 hypothetical protein OG946_01190 [Streptomyces sp. NBC_01808]